MELPHGERRLVRASSLVTDRHYQIAKWVRENLPDTDHRYDIWHMAKGIEAFVMLRDVIV